MEGPAGVLRTRVDFGLFRPLTRPDQQRDTDQKECYRNEEWFRPDQGCHGHQKGQNDENQERAHGNESPLLRIRVHRVRFRIGRSGQDLVDDPDEQEGVENVQEGGF